MSLFFVPCQILKLMRNHSRGITSVPAFRCTRVYWWACPRETKGTPASKMVASRPTWPTCDFDASKHLGGVKILMRESETWDEFQTKLDRHYLIIETTELEFAFSKGMKRAAQVLLRAKVK